MLTASSFAKVSGKLGALGKPLGLTAEMASVTMLPGPIEVRNHHSSAQSSSWGRMGWGKAALAPASSECSHQHFSLLSNIHPKKGPFASCPCQLFIYYKMHDFFCIFFISFVLPQIIFSLTHISILPLPLITYPKIQASIQHVANATLKIQHTGNQVKLNQGRQEKLSKF